MCPLCVALALACGPRSVAPRPDFLIGRALVFALWNSDRFSQARFLSLGVSRGLLACCSSLRTPRATSKVTYYYSSTSLNGVKAIFSSRRRNSASQSRSDASVLFTGTIKDIGKLQGRKYERQDQPDH